MGKGEGRVANKCDCHLYERTVCDICQGIVGKKPKDRAPRTTSKKATPISDTEMLDFLISHSAVDVITPNLYCARIWGSYTGELRMTREMIDKHIRTERKGRAR